MKFILTIIKHEKVLLHTNTLVSFYIGVNINNHHFILREKANID